MGCTNCHQIEPSLEMSLSYSTTARTVSGKNGEMLWINRSLLATGSRPQGGWRATLVIKDQKIVVSGTSANAVFANAKRLYATNEIPVNDLNLWFNLNIQWLERTSEKHRMVSPEQLIALAE